MEMQPCQRRRDRRSACFGNNPVSQTRKLAAILAADVVGYSRMMGEDEAGTVKLVRERRESAAPIVAAYGGTVFKTMGDAMLIEFPSVVAAVECALAMQRQNAERNCVSRDTRNIVYWIGVHLGDVLMDGADILGDAVNIAARLEGVAEPGRVCISGAAARAPGGRGDARLRPAYRNRRADAIRPGRRKAESGFPKALGHVAPGLFERDARDGEHLESDEGAREVEALHHLRCDTGTRTFSKNSEPRPIARWP